MPFGELALDVDSLKYFENYKKNYDKILKVMENKKLTYNVVNLEDYKAKLS